MEIQELERILKERGFEAEKLDSGYNYTNSIEHISLICYIEPDIEVEFITIYQWNNNEVKGTHNLSMKELNQSQDSVETLFRKTKNNMPQHIGEFTDTHKEVENAILKIFQ